MCYCGYSSGHWKHTLTDYDVCRTSWFSGYWPGRSFRPVAPIQLPQCRRGLFSKPCDWRSYSLADLSTALSATRPLSVEQQWWCPAVHCRSSPVGMWTITAELWNCFQENLLHWQRNSSTFNTSKVDQKISSIDTIYCNWTQVLLSSSSLY